MKFRLYLIIYFISPVLLMAQKKVKPALLVYGSDIEAFTAAVQSAQSSVATLWVLDQEQMVPSLTTETTTVLSNANLDGGIWMDMLMKIAMSKEVNDSLAQLVKRDINPRLAMNAVEKILSMQPNLTVMKGLSVESVERRKKDWEVTFSNKEKYAIRAIVDATEEGKLKTLVNGMEGYYKPGRISRADAHSLDLSRTTVAVGEVDGVIYSYVLNNILSQANQNLFSAQYLVQVARNAESIPLRAQLGQAMGAAAAYCAFFKTTTEKIDVRKLQTELITYGARLLPLHDVPTSHVHYRAIEKMYLSGLLTGKKEGSGYIFDVKDSVTFQEIKPIFNQLHSRSQLWFMDNDGVYLTWKDLLSLVRFVSFRGKEMDAQIKKDWSHKLKFAGEFDENKIVNREEFAVIVGKYADPYVKAVNMQGTILR
ncbi:FAD-dependent oxidoreductase [Sphingobacterium alkalisoli]|uniref:FAD-dependent oxidoreductase n=1 Tax=Sphingobacterium alkalisoli TaxID=1874115 RepID=A0A4V5LYV4_9SPHI|nr:FAD-dependent oxidoreductase [Sphingobacterium alkalisoli]TJY68089.1 FAD-dependent oxidoreductase [Sphingobacterium alkalisoli]